MDKIGAGVAVPRRVRQIRYGHPPACAPSLMASSARPIAEPLGSVPLPRRLQAPVSPAQAPGAALLCSAAAVMTGALRGSLARLPHSSTSRQLLPIDRSSPSTFLARAHRPPPSDISLPHPSDFACAA